MCVGRVGGGGAGGQCEVMGYYNMSCLSFYGVLFLFFLRLLSG